MIMPIDIDKKEFTRDKRGYNSREVNEFLDLIAVDYERVLNDNRSMAHKIKTLEKQLAEAQKSDTAMLETLETAKKLMSDISASAERRAELMMRDAELEAENMILDAKMTVKKINEDHLILKNRVERLRANYKTMLALEMEKLENDEYDLLPDLERSDLASLAELENNETVDEDENVSKSETLIVRNEDSKEKALDEDATVSDLADGLKKLAQDQSSIDDTIILK